MAQRLGEEQRHRRALRGHHPLLPVAVPWFAGAAFLGMWAWVWAVFLTVIPLDPAVIPTIPGPFFLLACGLGVGLGLVIIRRRRFRKWAERTAWAWVHPRPLTGGRLALAILAMVMGIGLLLLLGFWDPRWTERLGLPRLALVVFGFIPGYGAALMMQVFVYPEWMHVYRRARRLIEEGAGEESAADAKPYTGRGESWATAVGYLSIVAVVLTGAWWQWWLPARATAEPSRFTIRRVAGGEAVRLTYGSGVWSASISPDGKMIAYVPVLMPYTHLQLMAADGRGKRRVGAGKTWVAPVAAPQWSRDGTRLLVVGEQGRSTTDLAAWWERIGRSSDLWEVQMKSGRARRLTRTGDVTWGAWLTAGRMAVVRRVREGTYDLWLRNEQGREARQVKGLPRDQGSLRIWRQGQELVLPGGPDSPGIWVIEVGSGEVRRLSEIGATRVLPLDDHRLVVISPGEARAPERWAFSIGILDRKTGAVTPLVNDLQGTIRGMNVVPGKSVLVFARRANKGSGLWALSLDTGKMHCLADSKGIEGADSAPDGTWLLVRTSDEAFGGVQRRVFFGYDLWRLTPEKGWR